MKTIFDFRAFLNFLGRNKLYTAINIFGFSVSLMFVILLVTYTRQEYAVDQFHSNKERIFRLCNESGSCFAPLIGRDLKDRYPEIDTYVRIHSSNEIITGEGHHLKARYLLADPDHHIALFYAQHVLGCNIAYDIIHPTIRDLTYDCLELA